jgi:hypothetical protein
MANLPQAISNEKNTFPKQTAISGITATFGTNRRVFLANTGSPSGSPAPAATRDFKEGDWFVCLAQNYVGLVSRVVSDTELEMREAHGKTGSDQPCGKIDRSYGFKDISWSITTGPALIDGVIYPQGFSEGGNGFADSNWKPIIVDATTSKLVNCRGMY